MVAEAPALTEAGLKLTVVPEGTPPAPSATFCGDPFVTVVLIVDVPLLPCCTLRLAGLAASEKSSDGGAITVNARSTVCVALDPAPVTVIVYVPGAVLVSTVTVIVEELPEATEPGLKLTVVPAGCPLADSATVWDAPPVTVVPIVDVPLLPSAMLRLDGLAPIDDVDGPLVQLGNLNDAMRVCQLKLPFVVRYSSAYQNVQSSLGSTVMLV